MKKNELNPKGLKSTALLSKLTILIPDNNKIPKFDKYK